MSLVLIDEATIYLSISTLMVVADISDLIADINNLN